MGALPGAPACRAASSTRTIISTRIRSSIRAMRRVVGRDLSRLDPAGSPLLLSTRAPRCANHGAHRPVCSWNGAESCHRGAPPIRCGASTGFSAWTRAKSAPPSTRCPTASTNSCSIPAPAPVPIRYACSRSNRLSPACSLLLARARPRLRSARRARAAPAGLSAGHLRLQERDGVELRRRHRAERSRHDEEAARSTPAAASSSAARSCSFGNSPTSIRTRNAARRPATRRPHPPGDRALRLAAHPARQGPRRLPGYHNLREASADRPDVFRENLGQGWAIYFRAGNSPITVPVSPRDRGAPQSTKSITTCRMNYPTIVWVYRFPSLQAQPRRSSSSPARATRPATITCVYDPNYTDRPEAPRLQRQDAQLHLPAHLLLQGRLRRRARHLSRRDPVANAAMSTASERRVVVTGLGAVTPLGETFPASWDALIAGRAADAPAGTFRHLRLPLPSRLLRAACRNCPIFRAKRSAASRAPRASPFPPRARHSPTPGCSTTTAAARRAISPLSVSTTAGGMAFGENFCRDVLAGKRAHLFSQVERYLPQQQVLDLQQDLAFSGPSRRHRQRLRQRRERHRPRRRPDSRRRNRLRAGRRIRGALRTRLRRLRLPAGHDHGEMPPLRPETLRPDDRRSRRVPRPRIRAHAEARGAEILGRADRLRPRHRFLSPHPAATGGPAFSSRSCAPRCVKPDLAPRRSATSTPTARPRPSTTAPRPAAYRALSRRCARRNAHQFHQGGHRPHARRGRCDRGALRPRGAAHRPSAAAAQPAGTDPRNRPRARRPGTKHTRDLRHVMSVNLGFGGSNAALVFSR